MSPQHTSTPKNHTLITHKHVTTLYPPLLRSSHATFNGRLGKTRTYRIKVTLAATSPHRSGPPPNRHTQHAHPSTRTRCRIPPSHASPLNSPRPLAPYHQIPRGVQENSRVTRGVTVPGHPRPPRVVTTIFRSTHSTHSTRTQQRCHRHPC